MYSSEITDALAADRGTDLKEVLLPSNWRTQQRALAQSAFERAMQAEDWQPFRDLGRDAWIASLDDVYGGDSVEAWKNDSTIWSAAATARSTRRAIDLLFDEEENLLLLTASVSGLVERALHTFVDPLTRKRSRHLAAAKRHGVFFTPIDVALQMADRAIGNRRKLEHVLDPASGAGTLSLALLVLAHNRNITIDALSAIELQAQPAGVARRLLQHTKNRLGLGTTINVQTADALPVLASQGATYDTIIMNPPYGRVKFLESSLYSAEARAHDPAAVLISEKKRVLEDKVRLSKLAYRLGVSRGALDMQKLFLAGAVNALTSQGILSAITPSSWTSGHDYKELRELIVRPGHLREIICFPEKMGLFTTVNQTTVVTVLDNRSRFEGITITEVDKREQLVGMSYEIRFNDVVNESGQVGRIAMVGNDLNSFLKKLSGLPRLADSSLLRNARGEVDLTLDASLITAEETPFPLVRGDHVERFSYLGRSVSTKESFVRSSAVSQLKARPKGRDSSGERIVGRQVAYMGKPRRLSFAVVPPEHFVANSCNYLVASRGVDPYAILGVMNSSLFEWWFRVHSSNNHVANHELNDMPWPESFTDEPFLRNIGLLARAIEKETLKSHEANRHQDNLEALLDAYVLHAVGAHDLVAVALLNSIGSAHSRSVVNYLRWLSNNTNYHDMLAEKTASMQHDMPTLSQLDRDMIDFVPQGGNWQQIPTSVPSARLDQIRAMSLERGVVRTTYYGRLRPDQPSYTIATYYNRPGNGTNIHPHQNRTLTHREAARLQSFPDSYSFMGTEGAIRKQIGNAVPPLLARSVGDIIRETTGEGLVVDLFAGAGGLSLGLEEAGLEVAVAVDFDRSCRLTYTSNRSSSLSDEPGSGATTFLETDLSDAEARRVAIHSMRKRLGGSPVRAVVGGPPCQGFSHAGFRNQDDQRNDLAVAFLDCVAELDPEVVVIENVEGILSYRQGATVKELIATMRELGYNVDAPWTLAAEQYGVPQMRRRVFLVGHKTQTLTPPAPEFARCLGRREVQGLAIDPNTITLPYPVTVEEAIGDLQPLLPVSHASIGERVIRPAYAKWVSSR